MNQLALSLLIELRQRAQYGDTAVNLLVLLRVGGHRGLTAPEMDKALRDAADKSWVTPFESPISGKRWRITALGESALKEEGL